MVRFFQLFVLAFAVLLTSQTAALAVSDTYRAVSARLTEDAAQQLGQGKVQEADRLLNLALTAHPGNARAFVLKGQAQGLLDNKQEGLRLITVGLEIEPSDQKALALQGAAALEVGDIELAEKSLSRLRTVCNAPCAAASDLAAAIQKTRIASKE